MNALKSNDKLRRASEWLFSEFSVISALFLLLSTGRDYNWDVVHSVVIDVLSNYRAAFSHLVKCRYYFWPWGRWEQLILARFFWGLSLLKQRNGFDGIRNSSGSQESSFLRQWDDQVASRGRLAVHEGSCTWGRCAPGSLRPGQLRMLLFAKVGRSKGLKTVISFHCIFLFSTRKQYKRTNTGHKDINSHILMFPEVLVKKQKNWKLPGPFLRWNTLVKHLLLKKENSNMTWKKDAQSDEVEKSGIHNNAIWILWYKFGIYLEK